MIPFIGYIPSRFNFDFVYLISKHCRQLLISSPVKYCLSIDCGLRQCLKVVQSFLENRVENEGYCFDGAGYFYISLICTFSLVSIRGLTKLTATVFQELMHCTICDF